MVISRVQGRARCRNVRRHALARPAATLLSRSRSVQAIICPHYRRGNQQVSHFQRDTLSVNSGIAWADDYYSVDAETDAVMQNIIRTHFKEHTIIAIAHKLETVLDFDKIAILEGGQIVAFDTPKALLSRGLLNSDTLAG